jgi:hypothetical protein
MLQAAPQFTPFQLLDAARRAEADGHIEAAFQFYRQTVDQYGYSLEAAEAREGLARLTSGWQPNIWHLNGTNPTEPPARLQGSRKVRRGKIPVARNHYRAGNALAKLVGVLGWLIVAASLFAAPLHVLLGRPDITVGLIGVLGATLAVAVLGLFMVTLGQATRALFDQANATRELVAIERAKSGWE